MKTLFTVGFVAELLFGLTLLALPVQVAEVLSLDLGAFGVTLLRLQGSAFVGFATLLWLGRRNRGRDLRRVVLITVFVFGLISTSLLIYAQIRGLMNPLGWAVIDVQGLLTLAFGFYLFRPRNRGLGG